MRTNAINYLIASVWMINGLFCKLLNLTPRHQEIVARILGSSYASLLIKLIGVFEIGMAIWILTCIKRRLNAATQIVVILTMNALEFVLTPDLLLWGRFNILFALLFVAVIFYNEFYSNKLAPQN